MRKTVFMIEIEKQRCTTLEDLLPEMVNDMGQTDTASSLGISKSLLNYWLLKMGIRVQRVALRPGEFVKIEKEDEP